MTTTEGSNTMKGKTPTIIAITALVVAVLAATPSAKPPAGSFSGRTRWGRRS
jgi:hypothetical protein